MIAVSAELKARVAAKVAECIQVIEAHHGIKMPALIIKYDINSARIGGLACLGKATIRYNPVFLAAYTEKFLNTTVPHEVAHHGVREVWRQLSVRTRPDAHGNEWKRMMYLLGVPASRCHDYEVPEGMKVGKQMTKHHYKCSGCQKAFEVGAKVHGRIQRGSNYRHTECGKNHTLVYAGTPSPAHKTVIRTAVVAPNIQTLLGVAPRAPQTPTYNRHAHAGMTKFDRCLAIYMSCPGMLRASVISKFENEVDMTAAGASTYYQRCKIAA